MRSILLNGEPAEHIHILDRGLQYGDGLFETLRVEDGQLPLWPYHWRRLLKGCEALGIPLPDQAMLQDEINALISAEKQAVLKLILTRGQGERGYAAPVACRPSRILMLSDRPDYPENYWQSGIRVYACQTRLGINPALAGIKHLNRLEQVMARNEWQDPAYQEGLMQDTQANIIEGTMSNIFWINNNQLYTPDLSGCGVEGVMREIVMALAKDSLISTNIGLWPENKLAGAEEIFITNSLIGVWPVSYILNKTFAVGPVTQQLQSMLQAKYGL